MGAEIATRAGVIVERSAAFAKGLTRRLGRSDLRLLYAVNQGLKRRWLDRCMSVLTHAGSPSSSLLVCAALLLLGRGFALPGLQALAALASSHIAVQGCKFAFKRKRPYLVFSDVWTVANPLRDPSFPSGHTAAVFAVTVSLASSFPALGVPLLALASAVGFSRTYLGLHYPSDVLMGALFGGGAAHLSRLFFT